MGGGLGQGQSASPFRIISAADQCLAVAYFRHGNDSLRLGIDARPTTDEFVIFVEAPGELGRKPWIQGRYTLGPSKPERDWVVVERSSKAGSVSYMLNSDRLALTSAGPNARLKVQIKPAALQLDMQVPGLDEVVSLLDSCSSDLLEKWGYSKDFQRQLSRFPEPEKELKAYTRSTDYPRSALLSGAMGETHALVDVDANRRASNCRIVRSSGHKDLDAMSCKIVTERVRYEPGRVSDGAAVVAPAYLTMRWEIAR